MVNVVEYRLSDPSSIPGHSANTLGNGMNSTILPPPINK